MPYFHFMMESLSDRFGECDHHLSFCFFCKHVSWCSYIHFSRSSVLIPCLSLHFLLLEVVLKKSLSFWDNKLLFGLLFSISSLVFIETIIIIIIISLLVIALTPKKRGLTKRVTLISSCHDTLSVFFRSSCVFLRMECCKY